MEKWHVYQLRSDTELLYVGYSRWLKRRLYEHGRYKAWWPEVTDIQSEEFATEDEARRREKELWAGGRPKYNRQTPFLTPEESRAKNLARKERFKRGLSYSEYLAGERERNRARLRTPEGRAQASERQRRYRARGGGKRWQQSGPGLF
jgi:predicted GIY-YIG superfamily endonuclease